MKLTLVTLQAYLIIFTFVTNWTTVYGLAKEVTISQKCCVSSCSVAAEIKINQLMHNDKSCQKSGAVLQLTDRANRADITFTIYPHQLIGKDSCYKHHNCHVYIYRVRQNKVAP